MKLKLTLPQTSQSWTLKPGRNYTVGTSPDCEIALPVETGLSKHHITFSYDETQNTWKAQDVSQGAGVYVNGASVQECLINSRLKVDLAHKLTLVVGIESAPKLATPPPMIPTHPPQPHYPTTYSGLNTTPGFNPSAVRQTYPSPSSCLSNGHQTVAALSSLPVLTWRDYVHRQVESKASGFEKLSTWFHLTTGRRNTPWVKSFGSEKDSGNFNSFEGYIIPNFKGSVESVISAVEEELGSATKYEDTDCYVAKLTDAHIANTLDQSFLKPELFPIHRGGRSFSKGDYRRFCIMSYHRVRTYLLIEKYGDDLFVSWITRYEPEDSGVLIILWSLLVILATIIFIVIGAANNSFSVSSIGLVAVWLWLMYFVVTPKVMQVRGILPNAANARLVDIMLIVSTYIMPLTPILITGWLVWGLIQSGVNFLVSEGNQKY